MGVIVLGGTVEGQNALLGSEKSSTNFAEKSMNKIISNEIDGARKVFDATKLRSVLQEQKLNRQLGSSNKNDKLNTASQEQLRQNSSPFTKTQDFFKSVSD